MFRRLISACLLTVITGMAAAKDPVTERPGGGSPLPSAPAVPAPDSPAPMPAPEPPIPAPSPAPAPAIPAPVIQQATIGLPGSLWLGVEEINNRGRLILGLRRDGTASMRDAHSLVQGRWNSAGDEVTLTFANCVYRGKVEGQALVGRAEFTSGPDAGKSWGFAVGYVNAFAGSTYEGRESLNGFGNLIFRFGPAGEAEMIDTHSTVKGRYVVDVNVVTITFRNCVYVGQIEPDGRLVGTARITDGTPGAPWGFAMNRKN